MTDRPNILLITSDQQRGDCFGFEGRSVKTPHLDRMARNGTHFGACITPSAFCQPARASMLTGLLPYTHGVADNGINLDQSGIAERRPRSGIHTVYQRDRIAFPLQLNSAAKPHDTRAKHGKMLFFINDFGQ